MRLIIDRKPAAGNEQTRLLWQGATAKRLLKVITLLGLMFITERSIFAQQSNNWTSVDSFSSVRMPADPPSSALWLVSENPPLLPPASKPSFEAISSLAPLSPALPVSLSPAARPEMKRQYTLRDRFGIYLKATYGPDAVMGAAFDAAYDQMVDDQPRWGRGGSGYGRRIASEYAPLVVSNTIAFGIAAADHEDPHYFRSHEHGLWPRTRYAIVHTFISQIDGGGRTFAFARIGGTYGTAIIANAWLPERQAHLSSALDRGSMCLVSDVAFNVLREFTPDIKKLLRRL